MSLIPSTGHSDLYDTILNSNRNLDFRYQNQDLRREKEVESLRNNQGSSSSTRSLVLASNDLTFTNQAIANIALERLKVLKEQMFINLSKVDHQRALELLTQYEKQLFNTLDITLKKLVNSKYLITYQERLLDPSALERIKRLIEQRCQLRESIERTFNEQIDAVNQEFPRELEAYLNDTIAQINTTLHIKQQAFNAQVEIYLTKMKSLEEFLQAYTSVIPAYSIYGNALEKVESYKIELQKAQKSVIYQIKNLSDPGQLKNEIKEKIEITLKSIESNKNKALDILKQKKISTFDLKKSEEITNMLKEVSDFYLESMDRYLSLTSESINQLIAEVQKSITITTRFQDEQMIFLTKQAESIISFLNQETTKVLEIAQASQKPLTSEEIGENIGVSFDDKTSVSYGRISKISVGSGWWLDSLQCTYKDSQGNEYLGTKHGGDGGSKYMIDLTPDEKIIKVIIGYGAFTNLEGSGVEELTFSIFNSETGSERTCGPYGRSGCSPAMDALSRSYGNRLSSVMKTKTITFGKDYYLGAIKGRENRYITSLALVFFKDFSSVLKKDLSVRLTETIRLLKKRPDLKLAKSEQEEIRKTFDNMYIDLKKAQNDPYAVLGLTKEATEGQVVKAYRKLCLVYHPDKIKPEEQYKAHLYTMKFKQIGEAYQTILASLKTNSMSSSSVKPLLYTSKK